MMRTILRQAITMLVVLALVTPGVALGAGRDDALQMAATMKNLGYADEAWQVEQLVGGMSDSQLQLFTDLGFSEISAKFEDYLDMKKTLDEAGYSGLEPPVFAADAEANSRAVLPGFDPTTFPDAAYPDDPFYCFYYASEVGVVAPAQVKVALKGTIFALREVLTAADGVQRAAMPACNAIVIAIGGGGNAAGVCTISAIALSVADAALDLAEVYIDDMIFCDEQVHFEQSAGSLTRLEYTSHQVEIHDLEIGEQLALHDDEVQVKLRDTIARAIRIESKMDLGLKTQLEVSMDRKYNTRPSVSYEERLDELCDLAQEAIDELPSAYVLAKHAQRSVDHGLQFKTTDPKRAASECVRGFTLATSGSVELQ